MKKLQLFWMLLALGGSAVAQYDISDKARSAIAPLAFMVGDWEGVGVAFTRDQKKEPFRVKESIRFDVDSTVLHIVGIGTTPDGSEKNHHALAVLYYDIQSGGLRMHSHVMQGQSTMATVELLKDRQGFKWWFEFPAGKMEYIAEFDEERWTEKGFFVAPDGTSQPMLEMTLKRK